MSNPPVFPSYPATGTGPSLTSPPTSLSGSPLHKPQTGWQSGGIRPTMNSGASTSINTPQHSAKTPNEAQPDYSRTHFDSVFGRSDYGKVQKLHIFN